MRLKEMRVPHYINHMLNVSFIMRMNTLACTSMLFLLSEALDFGQGYDQY